METIHDILLKRPSDKNDKLNPSIVYFLFRWGFYMNENHTEVYSDTMALSECHAKGLDVLLILVYLFNQLSVNPNIISSSERRENLFKLNKEYLEKVKEEKDNTEKLQ